MQRGASDERALWLWNNVRRSDVALLQAGEHVALRLPGYLYGDIVLSTTSDAVFVAAMRRALGLVQCDFTRGTHLSVWFTDERHGLSVAAPFHPLDLSGQSVYEAWHLSADDAVRVFLTALQPAMGTPVVTADDIPPVLWLAAGAAGVAGLGDKHSQGDDVAVLPLRRLLGTSVGVPPRDGVMSTALHLFHLCCFQAWCKQNRIVADEHIGYWHAYRSGVDPTGTRAASRNSRWLAAHAGTRAAALIDSVRAWARQAQAFGLPADLTGVAFAAPNTGAASEAGLRSVAAAGTVVHPAAFESAWYTARYLARHVPPSRPSGQLCAVVPCGRVNVIDACERAMLLEQADALRAAVASVDIIEAWERVDGVDALDWHVSWRDLCQAFNMPREEWVEVVHTEGTRGMPVLWLGWRDEIVRLRCHFLLLVRLLARQRSGVEGGLALAPHLVAWLRCASGPREAAQVLQSWMLLYVPHAEVSINVVEKELLPLWEAALARGLQRAGLGPFRFLLQWGAKHTVTRSTWTRLADWEAAHPSGRVMPSGWHRLATQRRTFELPQEGRAAVWQWLFDTRTPAEVVALCDAVLAEGPAGPWHAAPMARVLVHADVRLWMTPLGRVPAVARAQRDAWRQLGALVETPTVARWLLAVHQLPRECFVHAASLQRWAQCATELDQAVAADRLRAWLPRASLPSAPSGAARGAAQGYVRVYTDELFPLLASALVLAAHAAMGERGMCVIAEMLCRDFATTVRADEHTPENTGAVDTRDAALMGTPRPGAPVGALAAVVARPTGKTFWAAWPVTDALALWGALEEDVRGPGCRWSGLTKDAWAALRDLPVARAANGQWVYLGEALPVAKERAVDACLSRRARASLLMHRFDAPVMGHGSMEEELQLA